MNENIASLLSAGHYSPEEALSPVSVTGRDRIALTQALESMNIERITVDRGYDCQTLRKGSKGWYLTCRNSKY